MEMKTWELIHLATLKDSTDDDVYTIGENPFIDYLIEDKSIYPHASEIINAKTGKYYKDRDGDFLVGKSNGFLMNIDFIFVDTHKFCKVANYYDKFNEYCSYNPDTIEYQQFWARETKRRRQGVSAKCKLYIKDIPQYFNPFTPKEVKDNLLQYVRITGAHYNYLNYGRIERTLTDDEREANRKMGIEGIDTKEAFPRFWDGDYWNFKIDEFIADNGFNLTKSKARRKGFSYKRGSQAANTVNLFKNITVTMLAFDITYLTSAGKTSSMIKTNLDWFENHTYWRRGYLSESLEQIELGYKKSKEGNKRYGFRSKVLSFATRTNPAKAIGGKSYEIDCEEAGKFRNLRTVLGLVRDNMKSGKLTVGTLRVYGTGGEKDVDWADFSHVFYHPYEFDMLPMENVWDKASRHKVCGFFFPYIWNCEPYLDEHGNSLVFTAWGQDKKDDAERKRNMTSSDYTLARSQNANSPAEAFVNTTDNLFIDPRLITHIDQLKTDNKYKFYNDGWYQIKDTQIAFLNKQECISNRIFPESKSGWHEYIEAVPHQANTDVHGIMREYYPPYVVDGEVPENMYFASVDTYKVDKVGKDVTDKHSLYSFQIWAKHHHKSPYRKGTLIASYCGRLDTMEANDWLLYMACRRYSCKALIEAGTGETISNFKKWKATQYLAFDPSAFLGRQFNSAKATFGIVIGDGEKKMDGVSSLKDFIYEIVAFDENEFPITRLEACIYDLGFCKELLGFNAEGNFDRISSAIVAMFEFRKDAILAQNNITHNQYTNGAVNKDRLGYKLKRRIKC